MSGLYRRVVSFVFFVCVLPADAGNVTSWIKTQFGAAKEHVVRLAQEGNTDIYLTGYTVHAGDGYTKEQRSRLNALAYGGGFGKRRVDENGHENFLYAIVFSDSHYDPEPVVGYARQWFTPPIRSFLSFGAGFTVALTARSDTLNYFPFPVVLPIATVRLKRLSLMATAIPRVPGVTQNRGSVLFFWGRYTF